jgi:hypothetical protein
MPRRFGHAVKLVWLVLLIPIVLLAGEPWSKPPAIWSLADVTEILTDSPWSPSKDRIGISLLNRRIDPRTNMPTDFPTAMREGGLVARAKIHEGTPLPAVSVLWWSSKTVRLAQQRLRQLKGHSPRNAALRAEDLPDFVIVVEGAEPLRILRDAAENIRETCYLILPGGMALDPGDVQFVEAQRPGEDFSAFHFLRRINGGFAIDPNAAQVAFCCKATAKTGRPGRPDTLSLRVVFEPRRMRVNGRPDL